jgi:hypothetical protein
MSDSTCRRLSDKILQAFNQACDQRDLEVAELLHQALELVLTRAAGPQNVDKRQGIEAVVEAYGRLVALRESR